MLCLVVGVIIGFLIKGKPRFCRKASKSQNKGSTEQGVAYYNTESSSNRDPTNAINTENGYIGVYSELDDVNNRAYANVEPYESTHDQNGGATDGKDYVNMEGNENYEYGAIWDANKANA